MPMYFKIPDISSILRLREFIGAERALNFGEDHPLGAGFRAVRRLLKNPQVITSADEQLIANTNMKAELILQKLLHRVPHHVLRGDLCNAGRCRSLMFEAHCILFVVQPSVEDVVWRRYEEGCTDLVTSKPSLQVECKLVLGEASIDRLVSKAFRHSHQRRTEDGPFVIITGTDVAIDTQSTKGAVTWIRQNGPEWFRRHRDVAGIVIVIPRPPRTDFLPLRVAGYQGLMFQQGEVIAVRSEVATERLPDGFNLGS